MATPEPPIAGSSRPSAAQWWLAAAALTLLRVVALVLEARGG